MGIECEPLLHRQRYRLKAAVDRSSLRVCPDWFDGDAAYEGDIDPSSQDVRGSLRIRLLHPRDHEITFLVDEEILEEVD